MNSEYDGLMGEVFRILAVSVVGFFILGMLFLNSVQVSSAEKKCQMPLTKPTPLAMESVCMLTELDKDVSPKKVITVRIDQPAKADMILLRQPYDGPAK